MVNTAKEAADGRMEKCYDVAMTGPRIVLKIMDKLNLDKFGMTGASRTLRHTHFASIKMPI